MTFDAELTLIAYTSTVNEIGDAVMVPIKTTVLCDVESVRMSEHYASDIHGLKPEIVFVVNKYEYGGQQDAEFEGALYRVIRTYQAKKTEGIADFDRLEIVCARGVDRGTT